MIELRNVDFSYGDRPVLRNVSLTVGESEAVAIMGPSGSGKSTILRLILGLEFAIKGQVIIDDHDIGASSPRTRRQIRKNIGMVFQDGALFDSLTVGENTGYYLIEHTTQTWEQIEQQARKMLGFVGLDPDDVIDKLPELLSGGMQRRVAIGRALLSTDPRIMLYDEPTTGLDPDAIRNVVNLINKLHQERSVATIVVTHQIADALALADRFVVVYHGEVVFDGSLEELRQCRDEHVVEFLAPFRTSMAGQTMREFMGKPEAG